MWVAGVQVLLPAPRVHTSRNLNRKWSQYLNPDILIQDMGVPHSTLNVVTNIHPTLSILKHGLKLYTQEFKFGDQYCIVKLLSMTLESM